LYRPAFELADILRQSGPAYRQNYGVTSEQDRAIDAILNCRTAVPGGHVEECCECAFTRIRYNSCRNRLESPLRGESRTAPKCQSAARTKWVEARQAELLPVEYFHVVFTLPEPIARIAYYNRKEVYNILFQATAKTLTTIAGDPQHLGADIGFFAVLHTWGQNLLHHPQIPFRGESRTSIVWFPAADSHRTRTGCHAGPVSSFPSKFFRGCSAASSWKGWKPRSTKENSVSSANWRDCTIPLSSCVIWLL
jgi:transposase-like zinc-binding protein